MAGYRIRSRTNASIKSHYQRARMMASRGFPDALKLTMLGISSRRGGWRLRWAKLYRRTRKASKQLRGTSSTNSIREISE